jgi:chemotaxis protein MotA
MAATTQKSGLRPDFATIGGIVLAAVGILGGLLLEGGQLKDVIQITAALIVVGGTLGSVMVNTPMHTLLAAGGRMRAVLVESAQNPSQRIEVLIDFATKARKAGIVSLEREVQALEDLFLKKALSLAMDGADLQDIRNMLELEMTSTENRADQEAKVFESAGGYAPTIGIIGAVLGLIQVMKNLSDVNEVGHGIAVSFVATVYGVALANILLLPIANKIKARAHEEVRLMELTMEGVTGIVEGMNPKLLRIKLEAFAPPLGEKKARA